MAKLEIDGRPVEVPDNSMIMDATNKLGIYVPYFCYHRKLSIAANCRMCLVQVEKAPKPLPACATPVTEGMKVYTHSEAAIKAQKGVIARACARAENASCMIWRSATADRARVTTNRNGWWRTRTSGRWCRPRK